MGYKDTEAWKTWQRKLKARREISKAKKKASSLNPYEYNLAGDAALQKALEWAKVTAGESEFMQQTVRMHKDDTDWLNQFSTFQKYRFDRRGRMVFSDTMLKIMGYLPAPKAPKGMSRVATEESMAEAYTAMHGPDNIWQKAWDKNPANPDNINSGEK